METAIAVVFQLAVLIFSVVIHEVAHGLAAGALGDHTAKYAGRLTLNPIKHLDPVGSFLVPMLTFVIPRLLGGSGFIIGWAKPVPYNPHNFKIKNQDLGAAIVGAAGPAANITVALIFGFLLRIITGWHSAFGAAALPLAEIMSVIVFVNLILAVFNLVPIPPLDGSKVLFYFLPRSLLNLKFFLEHYGFIVLLLFVFYFSSFIAPIVIFLFRLVTGTGL